MPVLRNRALCRAGSTASRVTGTTPRAVTSTSLRRADQRQLLLQVALPRLKCYRNWVVASPCLLPTAANHLETTTWRKGSQRTRDENSYAHFASATAAASVRRRLASSTNSAASAATTA